MIVGRSGLLVTLLDPWFHLLCS